MNTGYIDQFISLFPSLKVQTNLHTLLGQWSCMKQITKNEYWIQL